MLNPAAPQNSQISGSDILYIWIYDFVWLFVMDFVKLGIVRLLEAKDLKSVTGTKALDQFDPTRGSMAGRESMVRR